MALDPSALDNILVTVKSGLGIQPSDTAFDGPITNHINSTLVVINELGVGVSGFQLDVDGDELWSQFLPNGDDALYALVKSYMILEVQALFDPPTSGIVTGAIEKKRSELVSRIVYQNVDINNV